MKVGDFLELSAVYDWFKDEADNCKSSVVQVLHETSVMLVKLTVYFFTCSFALNVRNTINCLCFKASTLEKQG